MWLPLTKARWQEDCELWRKNTAVAHLFPWLANEALAVETNAEWLVGRLYVPNAGRGARMGGQKLMKSLGVDMEMALEPINWGDLSASAEQRAGLWIVTLAKASPGQCPALVAYVQGWLEKWGWTPVIVQTEW